MERLATKMLGSTSADIANAAQLLSGGALVAFPTETVYGLGADARDGLAVANIYKAKGRPRFNPLIVHVASAEATREYVEWPADAHTLAQTFWPGPLSLVLPLRKDHGLSELVTAGLPTLAIRVPAHPTARALLHEFGGPVAAPSANPSGRISPTTADHVKAGLDGRIAAIIDDGPCDVGLESTIIGFFPDARLLRPGGLSMDRLASVLDKPLREPETGDPLTAPGQMTSHYAPNAPIRLNVDKPKVHELYLGFGPMSCDLNLSQRSDLAEAASHLFASLHQLDARGKPIAVAPIPETGLGLAINDRLRRAAAPR